MADTESHRELARQSTPLSHEVVLILVFYPKINPVIVPPAKTAYMLTLLEVNVPENYVEKYVFFLSIFRDLVHTIFTKFDDRTIC
jgi:hypothetical protein